MPNPMEDMMRWMMDPMSMVQRGVEVSEAYQTMLAAQTDMLRSMARYSETMAALALAVSKPKS